MRLRNLLLAFVIGAAVAAGLSLALRLAGPEPDPVPRHATVLPAGNELPEFALVDHEGNPADRSTFVGQWDLVFFGFTHCPDVCPTTMALLGQVRQQLEAGGQEPLPRLVLVSVDPERDTPDAIGKYVGYFGDEIVGITGELAEIRKLTDALGIFFAKVATDADDYTVDHSTVVLVINPEGRFRALFSAPHTVDGLAHDLPLIMAMR